MKLPESVKKYNQIILFDGMCNLCSGFMQFVYKRDLESNFKFTWMQDDKSREILNWLDLGSESFKTIILIEEETPYYKSSAFLKIVRHLRFPWPLLMVGYIFPGILRDWVYDYVAENRYRWFGKKDKCLIPTGELRDRFL